MQGILKEILNLFDEYFLLINISSGPVITSLGRISASFSFDKRIKVFYGKKGG
jgi:hypothetical protein